MALTGKNNEEKIWNYLKAQGMTDCGAAGLMGNLYAESGLIPTNLQNSYEKKLGYTDATYTEAVDSGAYSQLCEGQRRVWSGPVDLLEPEAGAPGLCQRCWEVYRRPGDPARLPDEGAVRQLQGRSDHAEVCHYRKGRLQCRLASV